MRVIYLHAFTVKGDIGWMYTGIAISGHVTVTGVGVAAVPIRPSPTLHLPHIGFTVPHAVRIMVGNEVVIVMVRVFVERWRKRDDAFHCFEELDDDRFPEQDVEPGVEDLVDARQTDGDKVRAVVHAARRLVDQDVDLRKHNKNEMYKLKL